MNYDILCNPSYSLLEVHLNPGETIVSEAGAKQSLGVDQGGREVVTTGSPTAMSICAGPSSTT